MSRLPRKELPKSGFFHVICRSNNHISLFCDDDDHLEYIDRVVRFQKRWPFELNHYAIMRTHVHFVIRTEDLASISKAMQTIELSYFHHYRKKYKYSGHLWNSRFRSLPIQSEKYLFECGRYIELNPVRAEVVSCPEEYRWSSYRYYCTGEDDKLIKPAEWYLDLDQRVTERQRIYKAYIYEGLEKDYAEERKVYESPEFIGDVSQCNPRMMRVRRKPWQPAWEAD